MHYVGFAPLAAAVSNAGGLGTITALTQPDAEALRREIRACKKLTARPFGVNLTLLPALAPPDYGSYADVIIQEGIKIVETAGRNPGKWIKKFKEAGLVVIHKCVAVRHALTAQRLGADIISMDGYECAGHPGEEEVGNWLLLPIAARKLRIPFIVSGGCGDGRQLAAALCLGAAGMNMGTRFMATEEAPIHANIKRALVEGDERSTTHVMQSVRNTERVYKNKTAAEVQRIEKEHPGDIMKIRHLVSGQNYKKAFQETGDTDTGVWSCGPVMGLIEDVPTCKVLMERIVAEAEDVLNNKVAPMLPRSRL
uniref:Nitronate monooxygenase domain-containing protein n=1 Tax=Prasinoderma singulare TaxID=676789 RepID=A0A7S3BB20_9VIRI